MSNYNELKITYEDGRQDTITLTSNRIEYGEYQSQFIAAVEVPEIVEEIESYAFCDNNNLSAITLNEGLITIGGQVFQHGVYSSVTIPSTVTTIGMNAFNIYEEQEQGAAGNLTITCLATTPPYLEDYEGKIFGNPSLITAIYVPAESVEDYKMDWSQYSNLIEGIEPTPSEPGFTNEDIIAAYVGNEVVDKIYLGNTQIYPTTPGPTPVDYRSMPLTIEALSAGTLQLTNTTTQTDIYYNLNDGGWQLIDTDNMSFNVDAGDIIQFGATEAVNLQEHSAGITLFSGNTLAFKVYGNIESLEYGHGNFINQDTSVYMASAFTNCFVSCTGLIDAENLILPATALTSWCYMNLFSGCDNLTSAPALPATSLAGATNCYRNMFNGCTSLITAPELPATSLTSYCYAYMFQGCTSLTQAPALPAETSVNYCYQYMFKDCTSLTQAPELPATSMTIHCYAYMFYGCTSLTTAPELPATTLARNCYSYMFAYCTNLNYIKCLATNISASNCLNSWVNGVASSGTFVKNPNMSSWRTGTSGIPGGWTVQNAS